MTPMTHHDYTDCILCLATRYDFSVTSWGRTAKHNADVGGKPNTRHLLFLAVDIVLDDATEIGLLTADATRMGLTVVDEADHIHIQTP